MKYEDLKNILNEDEYKVVSVLTDKNDVVEYVSLLGEHNFEKRKIIHDKIISAGLEPDKISSV